MNEGTMRSYSLHRSQPLRKRRSPSRPRHRLSDCIAVNAQTGEIRRFVDVSGNEVLDDLQGIHPAPAQAELAAFWGKRKPTGIRERAHEEFQRQYQDERHRIRIPDLVHLLLFPIYGPVGNPLDLTLCCSLSMGLSINYISSVVLVFSSPRYPHVRENFEIVASDTRERNIMYSTKNTPGPAHPAFDPDIRLFQRYGLSEEERELAGNPSSWEGDLTRSEEHTSELQSHSDLVCRLLLEKKNIKALAGEREAGSPSVPAPGDLRLLPDRGDRLRPRPDAGADGDRGRRDVRHGRPHRHMDRLARKRSGS